MPSAWRGTSRALRAAGIAAILAIPLACSSSSPSVAPAPSDAGGGGGDEPAACLAASSCIQAPSSGQQCVTTVDATLVDPGGKPVADVPMFVCGTNLCTSPSRSGSDGRVEVAACVPFASPALKVFSDPQWAPFAALLPGSGPSFALGDVTLTPLPPQDGALLASGSGTVSSGGVVLTLSGTTVTFDVEHQSSDSQLFRAAAVAEGALPATLQGQVAAAWALAPLNTKVSPPVQLQVPNTPGWAPGAPVDVYLNGTDATTPTPPAPWGTWGLIGTGAVSADGASILLTAAQGGLPEIAMVGVKLHG